MTLNQKLKASAQELIRLLEESEKQHQKFIKARDVRLLQESEIQRIEAEAVSYARDIRALLLSHQQALLPERKDAIISEAEHSERLRLWNRLLDLDVQIATIVFSHRPGEHLRMLAARLENRY